MDFAHGSLPAIGSLVHRRPRDILPLLHVHAILHFTWFRYLRRSKLFLFSSAIYILTEQPTTFRLVVSSTVHLVYRKRNGDSILH